LALLLAAAPSTHAADAKSPYLTRLADRAAAWRERLPDMDASAARAAEGVIAGGNLYAFTSHSGFTEEACGRAGGLMMIKGYRPNQPLTANDTILAQFRDFATHGEDAKLDDLLTKAGQVGAQVVLIGVGAPPPGEYAAAVFTWSPPEGDAPIRITSMSDVLGLWAWTGRFIAACVQRGHMPCIFQSHGLPGGKERSDFLRQHDNARFHAVTDVKPDDAQRIAEHYLDIIESALRSVWAQDQDQFQIAAALIRGKHDAGLTVGVFAQGHLFPAEFRQSQQPDWITPSMRLDPHVPVGAAIVLEYQATPWALMAQIAQLQATATPIVVTCSQSALPEFTRGVGHVFIDPHWPLTDAVVDLPGYDVPLLPASGVMDAAVYWQLVATITNPEQP
jgi:uncharacterized phosphosugar-binding protein